MSIEKIDSFLSIVVIEIRRGGRLAQLDRALVSGTKGRGFNSRIAHHLLLIFIPEEVFMRKRIIRLSPFLLIILLGLILNPLPISEQKVLKKQEGLKSGIVWAQNMEGEGREQQDSHYIQLMRQLRTKVDGWLKDLNDRIESGDVTRFEVRFLEILRSVLEWVGEKIDAQIESGEKKPKKKTGGEEV